MIRRVQIIYCLLLFTNLGIAGTLPQQNQTHNQSTLSLCLKSNGKKQIAPLTKKEAAEIARRYRLSKSIGCLDFALSSNEMSQIDKTHAAHILVILMSNADLPTFSLRDLTKAAIMLAKAHVDLGANGKYLAKLLGYKYTLSAALNKTIQRQKMAELDRAMIARTIADDPYHFISDLKKIGLDMQIEARWIRTFGLCAHAYSDDSYKSYMRRIVIEKPLSKYNKPNIVGRSAYQSTRDILQGQKDKSPLNAAFRLFVNNINYVASNLKLNDFNKACMAKCIADEMLTFKSARDYPFLTPPLFYTSLFESGARNMALTNGMCLNYATITSTLLKSLNFSGKSELANTELHFFNVVTINGQRYHFHPMRKYGRDCSFFPIRESPKS